MAYRNRSIPDSDKGVRRFVYSFSRVVAADPEAYGFDGDDAALMVAEADALIAKMITATRPGTRTAPAVRAKNDCRRRVLKVFRSFVREVKANPAVEDWRKAELDLAVDGRGRKSPLPPPTMYPTLWITSGTNGCHRLGYWTTDAMTRRGKPRGASHLVLLCHVGDRPSGDPREARYLGAFTRYPITVQHRPADAGRCATYFGAWLTPSGRQTGWSPGVSMTIAVGGMATQSARAGMALAA